MISYFRTYFRQAHFLLLPLSFFLITACPDPPETTTCGDRQIDVNGNCECEPGYHWSEDKTECLMDTTSHNFVWEIDTLGISGSLRDVQIIDENNIWVVGEIETDSGKYGGAHWNGISWELKKLKGPGISVQTITPRGLWYFSEDNIWFASGSIFHWDGVETSMVWSCCDIDLEETAEKIWASSENDIYFVGRGGTIVHYNGTSFTKMASGTDLDLVTVAGSVDPETNHVNVWAGGWENARPGELLYYDGATWVTVWDESNPLYESGYINVHDLMIARNETLIIPAFSGSNTEVYFHPVDNFFEYNLAFSFEGIAVYGIGGNAENDLFIVRDDQQIHHFNGSTLYGYDELMGYGIYTAVSAKNDIVFACGMSHSYPYPPFVARGLRID